MTKSEKGAETIQVLQKKTKSDKAAKNPTCLQAKNFEINIGRLEDN